MERDAGDSVQETQSQHIAVGEVPTTGLTMGGSLFHTYRRIQRLRSAWEPISLGAISLERRSCSVRASSNASRLA